MKIVEILQNTEGGVLYKSGKETVFVPQENLQVDASLYPLGLQATDDEFWEKVKQNGNTTIIH